MVAVTGCAYISHSRTKIQQRELTDIEKTFISTEYELLYRIKELPTLIATLLLQRAPGIVNPGEPFNSSCLVDKSLSFFQMTWAGVSTETIFILYKVGGFVPHQRLLIIELRQGQISTSAEFNVPYYLDAITSLKHFVHSGKAIPFIR